MGSWKQDTTSLLNIMDLASLECPDLVGWLTEQVSGQRKWCVLADMFLCIFPGPKAVNSNPEAVIMLPGSAVRNIIHNSAKNHHLQDSNGVFSLSGSLAYQILIDTGKDSYCFSTDSQADMDRWIAHLKVSSHLDIDLFSDSDEECSDTQTQAENAIYSKRPFLFPLSGFASLGQESMLHVVTESRGENVTCLKRAFSLPVSPFTSVPQANMAEANNLHSDLSSTHTPIPDEQTDLISNSSPESPQTPQASLLSVMYVSSPKLVTKQRHSILSKEHKRDPRQTQYMLSKPEKERLDDSQDLDHIEDMQCAGDISFHPGYMDTDRAKHNGDFKGLRKMGSIEDLRQKLRKNGKKKNDLVTRSCEQLPRPLSSSWEPGEFGTIAPKKEVKVKKSASFKERIFGTKAKSEALLYGKLGPCDIEGTLQHRQLLKWTSLHCCVCKNCFYGYRSLGETEAPCVVLQLSECSLVLSENDKTKKMYIFKLRQLNARSLYFSAADIETFTKWVELLRKETQTSDVFQSGSECGSTQPQSTRIRSSVDSSSSHTSSGSLHLDQTKLNNTDFPPPSPQYSSSSAESTDNKPVKKIPTLKAFPPKSPQLSVSSAESDQRTDQHGGQYRRGQQYLNSSMDSVEYRLAKKMPNLKAFPPKSPQLSLSSGSSDRSRKLSSASPRNERKVSTTSLPNNQKPAASPHGNKKLSSTSPHSQQKLSSAGPQCSSKDTILQTESNHVTLVSYPSSSVSGYTPPSESTQVRTLASAVPTCTNSRLQTWMDNYPRSQSFNASYGSSSSQTGSTETGSSGTCSSRTGSIAESSDSADAPCAEETKVDPGQNGQLHPAIEAKYPSPKLRVHKDKVGWI